MKRMTYLFYVVGFIQIMLGVFHLFAPEFFLVQTGHSVPEADIFYPLGMLASRFLVIGVVFI
ncbi:hypothetical protein BHECKSOX_786 [Bathymodiolus heckerae thiotrophic gill symbiont]|uniref:hypothetical protein n=1 Tax=Bathymodiolus heckerae thiotrophic gill symbiont TaxID=1052212 RepID=UPI0010B3A758|nr:hypothetical protein [Bathymodiolus heckerae thiotrophic gill symbiont]SHN93666.1 hypothetical protein BHECKSOX_786 [Bathymodiolus heckerae thiotrophic gill symbiont]